MTERKVDVPMPLYDFHCRTCGHDFEALVRAPHTPQCPSCHGQDLERLLSTFAVSSEARTRAAAKASRTTNTFWIANSTVRGCRN